VSPRRPNRRADPGSGAGEWVFLLAVFALVAVVVAVWGAARIAGGAAVGSNPPGVVVRLVTGKLGWPASATWVLVGFGLVLVLVAAAAGWWWVVSSRSRHWIDAKATSMATAAELRVLTARPAAEAAAAMRAEKAGPGVPLAESVRTGQMLAAPWNFVQLWIMGPQSGKTSCVVVPQVCETKGPVFGTSNKRDLVDLTRGVRAGRGRLWIFDPQKVVAQDEPTWWWNPLTYVTDIAKASAMASLFSAAVGAGDKGDAYFEPEGEALLAQYLLAAAVAGETLNTVYGWLNDPDNSAPVTALTAAGETEVALAVRGTSRLPQDQRGGVFGTSRKMCRFLTDRHILSWVCPTGPEDTRPQLNPDEFVASTETVYAISKEGAGTTRALTAALTVAVAEAAERRAEASPLGRLSPPLLMCLDEVANIVRWPQLPDLLSHYGSKGIVVSAFLQSYSQGARVWGREGMDALWSACNVRGIGKGIAETDFLKTVSLLIGDHDVASSSVSVGGNGGSRSRQLSNRREPILEVADLAAIPQARAVVLVSGVTASLVRLRHWSARPYADLVRGGQEGTLPPRNPLLPTPASEPTPKPDPQKEEAA